MAQSISVPSVVGVRFSKVGKIYHFSADSITDVKVGDMVVVETSRGWQLGQVAQVLEDATPPPEGWKPVDRRATPRDLLLRQMWQMKEAEVVSICKAKAAELNLVGIKIVSAEYSFDGSRLLILFNSETEEKYDLKSMRSDMQKQFAPSQVEMRQVGPRDVAKVVCGMGACGLETRCCCLFLTEFSSISIRMAKEQGISLTPSEITGMCGRLRCCLIYEYDNYVDARAKLPKRNKRVVTPDGEGKVVDVVPLREAVIVEIPEVGRREYPNADVTLVEEGGGQGQSKGQSPAAAPQSPQARRAEPVFRGTQEPSEIDQAITGDESVHEFTISEDNPPVATDWEFPAPPPDTTQPPESRPPARPREERPGKRPPRQAGRGPGGKKPPSQQAGSPPGERGTGRENRPGSPPHPDRRGPRPGTGRPDRPKNESGNNPPRSGSTGGGDASKSSRDSRRRKGRRRDSSTDSNEDRA